MIVHNQNQRAISKQSQNYSFISIFVHETHGYFDRNLILSIHVTNTLDMQVKKNLKLYK